VSEKPQATAYRNGVDIYAGAEQSRSLWRGSEIASRFRGAQIVSANIILAPRGFGFRDRGGATPLLTPLVIPAGRVAKIPDQ